MGADGGGGGGRGSSSESSNGRGVGHGEAAIVKTVAGVQWPDEAATQAFAQRLAVQPLIRNAFIELKGALGAGKTTFVRHLLRALGVQGRVKSPTYAVVEPYELDQFNIWHFDFYRFNDPREWTDAGFRDLFASTGLKLAEWPQNAGGQLPLADLEIELAVLPDESRSATLTAHTVTGVALLQGAGALPSASTTPAAPPGEAA